MFDLHGETVAYDTENNKLVIIDQTKLPNETVILSLGKKEEIYTAIKELKLRGAPVSAFLRRLHCQFLQTRASKPTRTALFRNFWRIVSTFCPQDPPQSTFFGLPRR